MFKPLSLYIGLKYTRAKRRNGFISFISLVSIIGIALGVMVLITVLSVMNGFDQQIKNRIFTMIPHIKISGVNGKLTNWKTLSKQIKTKNILGIAPYVDGQGMLSRDGAVAPVYIQGILPDFQKKVSVITAKMIQGKLTNLKSGSFGMVIGDGLADSLGLMVGDKINLMIPKANISIIGIMPRFRRFTIVGIFHVGSGFGFDNGFAFIDLNDAQKLFEIGSNVSGLQIKTNDLFNAENIAISLQKKLGMQYQITTWANSYGAFYHAVQMEKTMMFFILILLIAIAVFNLVSGLVMLVNDKQADIAILKTLGANSKMIRNIFIIQGCFVGIIGIILGVTGGIFLSLHVTAIVNWIQNTFHVELFTPGVYFVDYLPSQMQFKDVFEISIIAFLMSLVATIYPSWRAAKTLPAEALRYE